MRIVFGIILSALLSVSLLVNAEKYSGTLPVIFIETDDTIASKYDYVEGRFYIDAMGHEEFKSLGSVSDWLPLQIRGRGNWTWFGDFEKKSYKIKLTTKAPLLNMSSNKHFALLAHFDGVRAFFRNAAGFWIGSELKMDFTPEQQPVELVLNGKYAGLYFLTETIRVGKNRVNIIEQDDYETNEELIKGGWLIELDNGDDEHQIKFPTTGTNLDWLWVTYHSPENLSSAQHDYLYGQVMDMIHAIYTADKNSTAWEELIDVPTLAKFYLTLEVLDQLEGFLGSCFLYKDRNESKWKFGPLWDLGHAFNDWHEKNRFIYDNDWEPSILEEIAKFPRFHEEVLSLWKVFYPDKYQGLIDYLTTYSQYISMAAKYDSERWDVPYTSDTQVVLESCLSLMDEKIQFLKREWGDGNSVNGIIMTQINNKDNRHVYYNLLGQKNKCRTFGGIYIKDHKKYHDKK